MDIPHSFPSLTEVPNTKAVLIVGAGLSIPTVPIVNSLKVKLDAVAIDLEVDTKGNFYELAERILNYLIDGGKTDAESRLWLAEKLGLLDDRHWFGEIGIPLSGNTPRHRVIARFAVEKKLEAIVSLNWDTLLETAMDSVGLANGARARAVRPWEITAHCTVIHDTDIKHMRANVFPIYKPHGCVRNLEQARRQFRTTGVTPPVIFKLFQSELNILPPGQKTLVDIKVHGHIAGYPLIAVGWKASEDYLRNTVVDTANAVKRTEVDSFTLVSRSWYPNAGCADTYHDDIANAYGKTQPEAFVCVSKPSELDCMFQWLQTRYSLNKLIAVATTPQKIELRKVLQQIDLPECDHPILHWADRWLPTWVRLCWRAGVMQGINPLTNENIDPWDIPIIPRDVHVPLGCMNVDRRELKAAAKLLTILGNDLCRFDFEKFPGGFWDEDTGNLYIPLPGWRGGSYPADLAALKPLIEALRGLGFVRNIHLVWLDNETAPVDQSYCKELAAKVARLMPLSNFATAGSLTWVDIETLKGDANDALARTV